MPSHTLLQDNVSSVNSTTYSTTGPLASSTAADLYIVAVQASDTTGSEVPTVSGGGTTWVLQGEGAYNSAATPIKNVCIFAGVGPTSGGTVKFTFTNGRVGCGWSISKFSSTAPYQNTTGAIAQVGTTADDAVTSLNVGLSAFESTAHATYAAFGTIQNENHTASTGMTEVTDLGYADPTARIYTEWRTGPETSPGVTWTNAGGAGGVALEIREGTAGGLGTPTLAVAWKNDLDVAVTVTPATGANAHTLHRGSASSFSPTTANQIATQGATAGQVIHSSTLGSTAQPRPRTQHYYKAVANSSGGSTSVSSALGVKTAPKRPTALTVTGVGQNYIDTTWTDRTTGDRHRHYRRLSTTDTYSLDGMSTVGSTEWRFQFLTESQTYLMAVASYATSWGQSGFATTAAQTAASSPRIGGGHV